jgi:PTH1 family peptidyl-tRNA hydrolase
VNGSPDRVRVIVGLGNPGKKYELTRHNIGFLVLEALARRNGMSLKEEKEFHGKVAKGVIADQSVFLLMPTTYMNESGRAVRRYLDFYKIPSEHLLVVVDDVALAFGQLRLRKMGSPGGHNGLKSIELHLGTQNYARLRMGIGRNLQDVNLADYVLGNFSQEEQTELPNFVQKGAQILERLVTEGLSCVMNSGNINV